MAFISQKVTTNNHPAYNQSRFNRWTYPGEVIEELFSAATTVCVSRYVSILFGYVKPDLRTSFGREIYHLQKGNSDFHHTQ